MMPPRFSPQNGGPFVACKRLNRRKCMWAYLLGLGVVALILVTSHLPRSGFNPTTFVDNDDPLEGGKTPLGLVSLEFS